MNKKMVAATYTVKPKTERLSEGYCLGEPNIFRTREYLFEQLAFFISIFQLFSLFIFYTIIDGLVKSHAAILSS
ncbi:MAG: hypothetical protein WA096_01095 [Smithella sp.]